MITDKIRTACLLALFACAAAACTDDNETADSGISVQNDATPPALDAAAPDAADPADAAAPDATDPADTGSTPDAGLDAGTADPCPREDGGRCAAITWTSTTTVYPVVVDHHTSFITEGQGTAYLNIAGGIFTDALGGAETVYDAVRRAPIAADGALGAWEDAVRLPIPLAFEAIAVHERRVYLLAGVTSDAQGPAASIAVYWADIAADGSIAEWKEGPSLPREVRLHATANVLNGRLYLIGGSGSSAVIDTVNYTALDPATGAPGAWVAAPALPAPRSHHTSLAFGGFVYVIAGFDVDQRAAPTIWRSTTGADGAIDGWEEAGQILQAPWTASSFVHRNSVFIVGGGSGSGFLATFLDRIRFAPILPDYTIGAFEDVDQVLPVARSHVHQTPIHNGHIYSVGGRKLRPELSSIDDVFVGDLW